MPEPLPRFRYHPDPVSTGTIEPSETQCLACGQARGYIYTGPVYAEDELDEQICPWCIADGRAHRDLGAEFTDAHGVGGGGAWETVPDAVISTIVERTPCFSGWQQERWFTCCGDAAAFLGRAGARELEAYGSAALEAIRAEAGLEGSQWAEYLAALDADGSPTAYIFRCLHCGRIGGYSDCD
jgi:uncharacterized protein CbrC (UPF0167 family)